MADTSEPRIHRIDLCVERSTDAPGYREIDTGLGLTLLMPDFCAAEASLALSAAALHGRQTAALVGLQMAEAARAAAHARLFLAEALNRRA